MRVSRWTLESEMTPQETAFLLALLAAERLTGRYLEIGTAAGGTLWKMMRVFPNEHRPRFVVVDPMTYFPEQLQTVHRNLREHDLDPDHVDIRTTDSARALQLSRAYGERFDFILIDGNHAHLSVMRDLRWTLLLNVGGIVCLHDYEKRFPGVSHALDAFLSRHADRYTRIGQSGSLVALRKIRDLESRRVFGILHWVSASLRHVRTALTGKVRWLGRHIAKRVWKRIGRMPENYGRKPRA